ncbi:N-acetylmuramoyl-L-alanine amidase family protein [Aquirhabdus parva]|uniref:N-acetylmuramoyl-L-alanine amidase n=1 Tax=Aquirhabdus parva TaxID=2283318 RepID=A0A345P8T0_9GAMM|nr:N-acetylmuramoyl-L-alanine amidase [Aquirhabdus parva]AXI03689.1 cell wall hydrolase [Aquirhabdus parva]
MFNLSGCRHLLAVLAIGMILPAHAALVIVDTGHTPEHPGATAASGRAEYRYNLDMTDALAADLIRANERVVRISADGKEIALPDRAIHNPAADVFVSIHHDSILKAWMDAGRVREFSGYSIFVSTKNPKYAESVRCAQAIGQQMLKSGQKPSLYHATPIAGENRPFIDRRLGVHRYDDLIVLKTAPMPSVLVEIGVIANPDDEIRVSQPETIKRVAHAISTGIQVCISDQH